MAVKPIPDGYHTVTPYLIVEGVPKLIDFVKQAFGATVLVNMAEPDGTVRHAEVKIGDSIVMMGEAGGPFKAMPASIHLYVPDSDAVYQRAIQAGATSTMELTDQFYGDRSGGVKDPTGNAWWISTHKEDIPLEEMKKRAEAAMKQQPRKG